MALVIEDGSGVDGANSYVSVEDATAFLAARGFVLEDGATYEPFLLQAMDAISLLTFKSDWKTIDGGGDAIPANVVTAQIWLAHYISKGVNPGDAPTAAVKREKIETLEIEYAVSTGETTKISLRDLPNAYGLLKPYLTSGSLKSGRVIRA